MFKEIRQRLFRFYFSVLMCLVVAGQIGVILLRGEAACFNYGCKVVEGLTRVSPLYFNLLGLVFFLSITVLQWQAGRSENKKAALQTLLLCGLAAEGVLMGYQFVLVKTFCSYCLIIFTAILLLNLVEGFVHAGRGVMVFGSVLAGFHLLNFGPGLFLAKGLTMASGHYAIQKGADQEKKLHLFFSSNCPHCQSVLETVRQNQECTFFLHPIDQLPKTPYEGLEVKEDYQPEVNRMLLAQLGIKTIPMMLAEIPGGWTLIKGESGIIDHLAKHCVDSSEYSTGQSFYDQGISELPLRQEEDGCNVEAECDEELPNSFGQ